MKADNDPVEHDIDARLTTVQREGRVVGVALDGPIFSPGLRHRSSGHQHGAGCAAVTRGSEAFVVSVLTRRSAPPGEPAPTVPVVEPDPMVATG